MMKKAAGTTKRGTGGVMKTKGVARNNIKGKAVVSRGTKAIKSKVSKKSK